MRWQTFTVLHDKFTRDKTYQILLKSAGFHGIYDKNSSFERELEISTSFQLDGTRPAPVDGYTCACCDLGL